MTYEVIIIGAGPSGTIAAMYLGRKLGKDNVLLVDKTDFPRDKICGDAQGRKAAGIMKDLDIYEEYEKLPGQKIYGIHLSSPNGTEVDIDVEQRDKPAPGYVHKRIVFDNFLFDKARQDATFRVFTVKDVVIEDGFAIGVVGTNEDDEEETLKAKIILGADGAHSIVARKFGVGTNPPEHFITATRAYYKNVKGLTDRIEIHLVKDLIPGYFWIFPLPNNEANVGLGMIIKDMKEKKINLVEAQIKQIKENPLFAERFKNAELIDEIRGWNLPIASYHRKCYGNGFMLLGDAAALIDPLSGEGVGQAMISGKVAAKIALEALEKQDFSEAVFQKYDKELWDEIGEEIKANYRLQKLGKMFPHLIDKLMEKASSDEGYRKLLESKLPYTGGRKDMGTKGFLEELGHGDEEMKLEVED